MKKNDPNSVALFKRSEARLGCATVYQNTLAELVHLMQGIYQDKRGDTRRILCGEPCSSKEGYCKRVVWEGWTCWQHGGRAK